MEDGTLLPGQTVDDFDVLRTIGVGSFGTVYEAEWRPYGRRVALKVLHSKLADNVEARARFRKESEAAAEVHHAHIVEMLCVGEFQGVPYVVMELLQGETLADALRSERRLSVEEAMEIVLPVLSAVSAIHDAGMVHRDLKPANIFLSRDARNRVRPIVLDFGIVKFPAGEGALDLTRPDTALGTPCYMSPEQVRESRNVGPASDQFSLGVTLYYALTRVRPFHGETRSVMTDIVLGNFVPPSAHWPGIPSVLNDIIVKTLAKETASRFASLRALGRALLPFASKSTRALWSREFRSEVETLRPTDDEILGVEAQPVHRGSRSESRRGPFLALTGAWLLLAVGAWSITQWGLRWAKHEPPRIAATVSRALPLPPPPPSSLRESPVGQVPVLGREPTLPAAPSATDLSVNVHPVAATLLRETAPISPTEHLPSSAVPAQEVVSSPVPQPSGRRRLPRAPIRRNANRPII